MLKKVIHAIALFLSICFAHADEAGTQLLAILKPIDNLAGHFDQQSIDKSGKLLQQQGGDFVVQKSGQFSWRVKPPYEQHIVSDGKIINIYDPDLEQLTIKNLDQKQQVVPLLLFSGNGQQIVEHYDVSRVGSISGPEVTFELKPRQSGSLFDKLVVVFSGPEAKRTPSRLEILDSLKQVTRIHFSQVLLNQSIDQKRFEFSAPEGVDVIDERH